MPDKKHLEEVAQFIRDHRSSESHFEVLQQKLAEEYDTIKNGSPAEKTYSDNLRETMEKLAAVYKQSKERDGSAWPEFENFVSHFERSVTDALRATVS